MSPNNERGSAESFPPLWRDVNKHHVPARFTSFSTLRSFRKSCTGPSRERGGRREKEKGEKKSQNEKRERVKRGKRE